jgi:glutamate 5-kinase
LAEKRRFRTKRVVVKVGTYTISDEGGRLDRAQIGEIVRQISEQRQKGVEVVLVSSGAIAAGVELLGLSERPRDIPSLQAASSVGQGLLLRLYTEYFQKLDILVGQVLFTQYDFAHREQYLNARNTFERLIDQSVIPLVNENDTVAVEEIRFGDNDRLAALVAVLTEADLLVMLSDVKGLYTADPKKDAGARLISEVERVTPAMIRAAGQSLEEHASGGMAAKLEAARIATSSGVGVVIAPGREPYVLGKVLKGNKVGTYFQAGRKKLKGQKHWIAYGARPQGVIVIDEGARNALVDGGKSLLPAGVLACRGNFGPGDAVEVVDESGKKIARGLCALSRSDLDEVKGLRSPEAARRLPGERCEEVIHRDYMVILEKAPED